MILYGTHDFGIQLGNKAQIAQRRASGRRSSMLVCVYISLNHNRNSETGIIGIRVVAPPADNYFADFRDVARLRGKRKRAIRYFAIYSKNIAANVRELSMFTLSE